MGIVDFIALVFAASAVVDAWFNGSIFADRRAYFQALDDGGSKLGELMSCRFCFSHHTPWILAALFFVPGLFVPEPWGFVLKLPVYSLAATRIGNIINACLPDDARYERGEEVFTYEEDDGPTTPAESDAGSGA